MKSRFFIFVFLCLFSGLGISSANLLYADEPTARAEVEKSNATIGEPVVLKIVVTLPQNMELLNGIPDPEILGLTVKELKVWQDKEDRNLVFGRSWKLTGFQLGHFMVDPVDIAYRAKGDEALTVQTNKVYLTIESIAAGEQKTDIRDVKGVVNLSSEILKYAAMIGIPAVFLALLAVYLLYFRKRELQRARRKVVLSPSDEALQKLRALFDSTLIRDGKIKLYYLTFSEILKEFLEKQFGIQATEATTSEIAVMLKRVPAPEDAKKKVIEVLGYADYAKFAKWEPPPAEILGLNQKAESVVSELLAGQIPSEGGVDAVS